MRKPITIEDYDPHWPAMYEEEKQKLVSTLGEVIIAVEHCGSTSIPGLGAKPVIDIMVGVVDLILVESWIEPLAGLSYEHMFSQPDWCHFSKKIEPRVNLHVFIKDSENWKRPLLFRDYLRAHPEVAAQYQVLKQAVAAEHPYNPAYVKAKAPFIQEVMDKAQRWREVTTDGRSAECIPHS